MDFLFVKQEPIRAQGIDGSDAGVVKPDLAALDAGKGIVDGGAGVAEALDFRALEFDARLVRLVDEVIAAGFVVVNRRRHRRQYNGRPGMFLQRFSLYWKPVNCKPSRH
jgi:hypothetical protein